MKRTHMLACRLSFVVAVALTLVAPAYAEPKPVPPTAVDLANYKRHFDTGTKLLQAQAFDVAAPEFEAAYDAVHNAQALRQALECYKLLHAAVQARDDARRLLDAHAKELRRTEKKDLEALILSLAPSIGQIELRSSEPGVEVTLDGKIIGATPLAKPVAADAGPHKLSFRKTAFEPFERDVAVEGEKTATVEVALEKEIVAAKVSVTERGGAKLDVVVDGKVAGATPWEGELTLGEHEIAGRSRTMDAPAQKIEVVKRKPLAVELVGVATVGKLEIATLDGKGSIKVDGKIVGEGKTTAELPVGKHVVLVERAGFVSVERKIDIDAGKTVSLSLTLEPAVPPVPPERPYAGVYGGISFAALLQAGSPGNQTELRCPDLGGPCTLDSTKGGGFTGYVGYTWKYIGIEAFLGGSADVSSPTAQQPTGTGHWDVYRVGGMGALRMRAAVQTHAIRAAIAAGPGVTERIVGTKGTTTSYSSLAGTVDASFALRTSETAAVALGCTLWAEHAGYGAVVDVGGSRTPFYLFSGPQYLVLPYLGLQFGP